MHNHLLFCIQHIYWNRYRCGDDDSRLFQILEKIHDLWCFYHYSLIFFEHIQKSKRMSGGNSLHPASLMFWSRQRLSSVWGRICCRHPGLLSVMYDYKASCKKLLLKRFFKWYWRGTSLPTIIKTHYLVDKHKAIFNSSWLTWCIK